VSIFSNLDGTFKSRFSFGRPKEEVYAERDGSNNLAFRDLVVTTAQKLVDLFSLSRTSQVAGITETVTPGNDDLLLLELASTGVVTKIKKSNLASGAGEANTASNIGTSGTGVYVQKVGVDLQFKNVKAASTKVTVTDNPTPHTIDIDISPANIAHQDLSGAGTNTHATIDSHIGSTSNPHSVTASQVGLGSVTNDAQLKRSANDFSSFTLKGTPASGDILPIEDSGASGVKKYITIGTLTSGFSISLPKGYIDGMGISSDPLFYEVTYIYTGICRSDDDTTNLISTGTLTVDLNASGANGLDTGTKSTYTWYYLWVIYNPSTATYAGLYSTSYTSPTMPSGYTKKRYVGSVYNGSSGSFRPYEQQIVAGKYREYSYANYSDSNLPLLSGGSATVATGINCSVYIPQTTVLISLLVAHSNTTLSSCVYLSTYGGSASAVKQCGGGATRAARASSIIKDVRTDSNALRRIQYYNSVASGSTDIWAMGYREILDV